MGNHMLTLVTDIGMSWASTSFVPFTLLKRSFKRMQRTEKDGMKSKNFGSL